MQRQKKTGRLPAERKDTMEIYGTIGPSCSDAETLYAMYASGMTGIRLNLSHATLEESARQIENIHKAASKCGKSAQLLIDLQGPELRIGPLSEPVLLSEQETVSLGGNGIPVPDMIIPCLQPGREVLLDDGKILLEICSSGPEHAEARVVRGGTLQGRKSIAVSGQSLSAPTLTPTDLRNIACAVRFGVTAVMQPFVRDRKDLDTVRSALVESGGEKVRLFAKIENREGIANLPELIPAADEIVIARGDLGNAMPLWELPRVQKQISEACRTAGKPFMVVTQMLASMENRAVPTRAEVSDIFNAVCDGASSVMVTGETAVGKFPVEVIRYLANTAGEAERYLAGNKNIR